MDEAQGRELRFAPKGTLIGVLIFLLIYGVGGGGLIWLMGRDLVTSASAPAVSVAEVALTAFFYLIVGYFLLLYVVFGPLRFHFYDAFFSVVTWRGKMKFQWSDVRRATLSFADENGGSIELALFIGRTRRVSVPLTDFREAGRLLSMIRARISVPLEASREQLALVHDSGASEGGA